MEDSVDMIIVPARDMEDIVKGNFQTFSDVSGLTDYLRPRLHGASTILDMMQLMLEGM